MPPPARAAINKVPKPLRTPPLAYINNVMQIMSAGSWLKSWGAPTDGEGADEAEQQISDAGQRKESVIFHAQRRQINADNGNQAE